jgi:hypothetical protein
MAKDLQGNEIPTFAEAGLMDQQNQQQAAIPKYQVKATDNNQLVPVDNESDLSTAILSDSYSVNPEEMFNVKKYDGSTGQVQGKNIKAVLSSGDYTLETKEETQLRNDEIKYGDRNLEAGVLGAARGLSFGASDQFLKGANLYEGDELRGLENANTVASIGGEVVGTVAPALLSGGTSLLAKGATKVGAGIAASEAVGLAAEKAIAKKILANSTQKLSAAEVKTVASLADEAATTSGMLSEKAAEKSLNLFSKSLEKSGYAASQAKSIANKMLYGGLEHMAPGAANLAVQGAMQGAGRLVTEEAFGTAEFNAENLLAYAGVGSIIGGTFGAALGLGKALVPSASDLASNTFGKAKGLVSDKLDSYIGKEKLAMNLVDLTPSALAKARIKRPDFDSLITSEVQDILETVNPKSYKEFDEAIISTHSKKGQKIRDIYKQADEINAEAVKQRMNSDATVIGTGSQRSGDSVSSNLIKAADDHLEGLGIAVSSTEREGLFRLADEFASAVKKDIDSNGLSATKLQDYAVSLQKKIYPKGGSLATEAEASQKLLRRKLLDVVRAEQRELVREAAAFSGTEATKGSLLDQLLVANKSYSVLNEVVFNSQKSLAKEGLGTSGIRVGADDVAVGIAIDPASALAFKTAKAAFNTFPVQKKLIMGSLDGSIQKAKLMSSKALKAFGTGVKETTKAAAPATLRQLVSSELAVKNVDGKKSKPKDESEAYHNIVDNAMVAVTDPERVLQQSNRQTAAMFEHAPNTAAAIDAKYLQVMQFIASKAKKSNKSVGIFDIGKQPKVSGFETAKMSRYLDAINNPSEMLQKAAKGTLSREHVEVMKNIYPEMHNNMKQVTMEYISKNETKLKYSEKLQLGLLLDMQSHESMNPQNIQSLQAGFNSEQESAPTGFNPGQVGKMSKSDSLSSSTEQHEIGD